MKSKKHILSICCLTVFIIFALGSRVNKLHYGAFNYVSPIEDTSAFGNFIQLNDGSRIYGNEIKWKSGMLVKDHISIDDKKFKISEVRGYYQEGTYYGRFRNEYIKRIVHGKVNVYVRFYEMVESTSNGPFTHSKVTESADHYAQIGEDGPMIGLANRNDIKRIVADCPIALNMVDKGYGKLGKAVRKDHSYMNKVFKIYNNGCKPLK